MSRKPKSKTFEFCSIGSGSDWVLTKFVKIHNSVDAMFICKRGLRRFFDVPSSATRLWVTFSTYKSSQAIKVVAYAGYALKPVSDGYDKTKIYSSVNAWMYEVVNETYGGKCWISVEYA